jgi:dienelactone hydrolase
MKRIFYIIILVCFVIFSACSSNNSTKNQVFENKEKDKASGLQKDEITISTEDGINISANYFYAKDKKEQLQPLIILIHQFKQNKEQWAQSFIDTLVYNGYKVLAYDIRGHGSSTKVDYELTKLLSDQNEAPADLKAVFGWAKNENKSIDFAKIGVMGTSIGGNLGCYSSYYLNAKTVIAVSNSRSGYEALLGIDPRSMAAVYKRISSVFLICGNRDGEHEQDAKYMLENYLMEPVDLKVYDSDKHGKYLIEQYPEIYTLALNWFKKNF